MKKPSSRSRRSPQSGHSLLTSNHDALLKSVEPPQFGHRLRSPRDHLKPVTFMGIAPAPASGAQLEADEPADLDVLAGLRDLLGKDSFTVFSGTFTKGWSRRQTVE
jgi:hypothetical protein